MSADIRSTHIRPQLVLYIQLFGFRLDFMFKFELNRYTGSFAIGAHYAIQLESRAVHSFYVSI